MQEEDFSLKYKFLNCKQNEDKYINIEVSNANVRKIHFPFQNNN